jgi:hypothetical protein
VKISNGEELKGASFGGDISTRWESRFYNNAQVKRMSKALEHSAGARG